MADWNPALYHRFREYRAAPFRLILERLPLGPAERIIDLGSGTGEHTVELARRSPQGSAVGIDNSPAMLARAEEMRRTLLQELRERVKFVRADFRELDEDQTFSLIFSNAALQWASDHRDVLRRCFRALQPNGQLVVQMPSNHLETAQTTLAAMTAEPPWCDFLSSLATPSHSVLEPDEYRRMLSEIGFDRIDCYYHLFLHPMENPAAIVEFSRATALRPFLDKLAPAQHSDFVDAFTRRLEQAYFTTGPLIFSFRRIFLWARRPA
jgi:trans-aconitate 2-methyltransferase